MKILERNSGLDIFRLLCCLGVVGYHVLDDILAVSGDGAKLLYYACSFCVPGFFCLSGYLAGCKNELKLEYCEEKILSTVQKLFGWIVFWTVIHFVRTGELYDIWENLFQSVLSGGIEPVGWFLFTYCIILVVTPIAHRCVKKYPAIFCSAAIVWMIWIATGKLDFITNTKTQSLWFHLYLGYFLVGMACSCLYPKIYERFPKTASVAALAMAAVTSLFYYREVFVRQSAAWPHQHYGRWYYSLWLIALLFITLRINVQNKAVQEALRKMANNTFAVYLGHLPILLYVTSLKPLASLGEAVVCILLLFAATQMMAETFRKLPLLRKIV